MRYKNIIALISVIYILIITTLMLVDFSESSENIEIPYFDKVVHIAIYFGMNFLLLLFFKVFMAKKRSISLLIPTFFTISYSILIEVIQPYVGRSFDLFDIAANCVGTALAIPIFLWLGRIFLTRRLPEISD